MIRVNAHSEWNLQSSPHCSDVRGVLCFDSASRGTESDRLRMFHEFLYNFCKDAPERQSARRKDVREVEVHCLQSSENVCFEL